MPPALRLGLAVTDVAFLLYWVVAGASALGLVAIPESLLYADASNARVVAWNWSFFPLDVAFSVTGLLAVHKARRGDPSWRPLALVSLVLTMVAGGMAVAYWTLLAEFNPAWFLPNLALLVWPVFFLPGLMKVPLQTGLQSG